MLSYPSGMTVSNRALIMLADALRAPPHPAARPDGARLAAGRQALLVMAHLRKGETYADLACGFAIGTTHGLPLRARSARAARRDGTHPGRRRSRSRRGKAFVILDGTLLRIDRVGMAGGRDRAFYSGKHKVHGVNVQVLADPAGRLVWISPALPGARHDMGAAREHGIIDALNAAGISRDRRHRLPGRRRRRSGFRSGGVVSIRTPAATGALSRSQKQVNTAHARQRGPGERANAAAEELEGPAQDPLLPQPGRPSSSPPFRPS